MDRRDFLRGAGALGALGTLGTLGVGGSVLEGCATTGLAQGAGALPAIPPVDMTSYLAQIDGTMAAISRGAFFGDLVATAAGAGQRGILDTGALAQQEQLSRQIMRTLTLTGMFRDLNPQDQAHPGMQARLWSAAAEFEQTLDQVSDVLTAMPMSTRGDLRSRLRSDPQMVARMAGVLDARAVDVQASGKRRRHLRSLMGQIGWRLREQDPSLLIDEFAGAYARTKQTVQNGSAQAQAEAPLISAPAQGGAQAEGTVAVGAPQPIVVVPPPEPVPAPVPVRRQGRGQNVVNAGLITMGISLGVGLVGAVVLAADQITGLVIITVGAAGLLAGLIVLIVGAVLNATG
jgi:hypothetical protein